MLLKFHVSMVFFTGGGKYVVSVELSKMGGANFSGRSLVVHMSVLHITVGVFKEILAIESVKAALLTVRLDPDVLDNIAHLTPVPHINTNLLGLTVSNEVLTSMTTPLPVLQSPSIVPFNGIDKKYHPATNLKVNRLRILDYLLDYPPCAIEEYPEAASSPEGAVGHQFTIDPNNFYHPKFNIQYLFGDRHGGVDNVYCGELLLHAKLGKPVLCNKLYTTCRGLKPIGTMTQVEHYVLGYCVIYRMNVILIMFDKKNILMELVSLCVHGKWQEFEMETWDSRGMKSITGLPVQFRHIHGYGFNIWIADAHKGQALGAGMYCQKVCKDLFQSYPTESTKILKDLTPYDHLKQFYHLYTVHFKHNIYNLQKQESVSGDILNAMLSLSSMSKIDINLIKNTINGGGPKAKVYHPESLIPLHIWQASPSLTNGNEQSH
ncbi:hypothetical protein BDQ17DRAFT_1335646 [Cyathus striatus]|nr:hypothetical protein BDQ17DRAFT_1335646 [Cyathus striatus]